MVTFLNEAFRIPPVICYRQLLVHLGAFFVATPQKTELYGAGPTFRVEWRGGIPRLGTFA
jgi:hypothetical protein